MSGKALIATVWASPVELEPQQLVLGLWAWRRPDGTVHTQFAKVKKLGQLWYAFSVGVTHHTPMYVADEKYAELLGTSQFPALPPMPMDFWTDAYVWTKGPFE